MSLSINYNAAAMNADYYLNQTSNAENSSIQKLSSGYKINSAADDPAGFVISEKLQSQLGGLSTAIDNSNNAINMVQTAEGALNQVNSLLLSMRNLAVNASNTGTSDTASIAADQAQINSAITQLNNISANTQFGQKNLLDGTAGVSATLNDTADFSGVNMASSTPTGAMFVNVTQAASAATLTGAAASYAAITDTGNAGTVTINGTAINVTTADTAQNIIDKINTQSGTTGVTAAYDAGNGSIDLTQMNLGSNYSINLGESAAIINGGDTANVKGTDAQATVTYNANSAVPADITTETYHSGKGLQLVGDSSGSTINLTTNAVADYDTPTSAPIDVNGGALEFQIGAYAGQTASLSLQSTAADQLGTTATGLASTYANGASVGAINLSTFNGAQDAIKIIDAATNQVSTMQANLGSFQTNVLQSNVNSLTVAQQNISATNSTISDTDMAAEMVNFTRDQIMSQAGAAMLGQANSSAQNILSIIKGQ